jgi:hypothetical protein
LAWKDEETSNWGHGSDEDEAEGDLKGFNIAKLQ